VTTIDYDTAVDTFLQGKAAMFYMGSWELRDYNDPKRNKIGAENIGLFNFPLVKDGKGTTDDWAMNAGQTIVINKTQYDDTLGDWLNHDAPIPNDVFRTAFFAYSAGLVARAAEVLGKTADAARYGQLHEQIKAAFRAAYVAADGRILGDTQSGYAFALAFDLLDDTQAALAAAHLVANIREHDWRPTTGLEGKLPMMLALAKIGRNDVAYRLLHNEAFPSWNFSIKNGATTIWERWDSWTPERGFGDANMNSFNHFPLGAVYQWMAENIGGIRKDGPAYKRLVIAPAPGGNLASARVSHKSVRGLIQTDWQLTEDVLDLAVIIPANTSATVILPAPDAGVITEGGRPLDQADDLQIEREAPGQVFVRAGSGCYQFQIRHPVIALRADA
jgi:alpha-L-rhamnosidase